MNWCKIAAIPVFLACVVKEDSIMGWGLLLFPFLLMSDRGKVEQPIAFWVRRKTVNIVGITCFAYLAALLWRREQAYGAMYLFHLLMGHGDRLFPACLWILWAASEAALLYRLVLRRLRSNWPGRIAVIALVGAALLYTGLFRRTGILYWNAALLGAGILVLLDAVRPWRVRVLPLKRSQLFCLGLLFAFLALRLMGESTEQGGTGGIGAFGLLLLSGLFSMLAADFLADAGEPLNSSQQSWYERFSSVLKRRLDIETFLRGLLWLGLFLFAVGLGLSRIYLSDYNPINGDFQNYNVWRRLLDGQTPLKDFVDYLGLGHLYVGGILTGLAGGSFTDSMFVSNTLTSLVCILFCYAMLRAVLRDKSWALVTTAILSLGVFLNLSYFRNLDYNIRVALNGINTYVTNSMRILRGAVVLPVCLVTGWVLLRQEEERARFPEEGKKNSIRRQIRDLIPALLSGSAIAWSNDAGIASYLSYSVLYVFFLLLREGRKPALLLRKLVWYGVVSFGGFLLAVTLLTRGHLLLYLKEMVGTAGYQNWYYGLEVGAKCLRISELYFDRYALLTLSIIVLQCVQIWQKREKSLCEQLPHAMVAYLLLTAYISATLYLIRSGRSSHDLLYMLTFVALLGYGVKSLLLLAGGRTHRLRRPVLIFFALAVLATALPDTDGKMERLLGEREGYYYPGLEGYLSEKHADLSAALAYVGTDSLFSTYASALEVETGRYQPTGRDYIIHALGAEQQEAYLETFRTGKYEKVQTIDFGFDFGIWLMNANWYFYRELLRDYQKGMRTSYSQFWEPAPKEQVLEGVNVRVETEWISERELRLHFYADQPVDALADVSVSYMTERMANFWREGYLNHFTYIQDDILRSVFPERWDIPYFLPNQAEGREIPVLLLGGEGCVTIRTYPADASRLDFSEVQVGMLLNNPLEFPAAE